MSFPGHIIDPVARVQRAERDSAAWQNSYEYKANHLTSLHREQFDEIEAANNDLRTKTVACLSGSALISVGVGLIVLSIATLPIALCVFGIALCASLMISGIIINCSSDIPDKEALVNEIERKARDYASRVVYDDV